MKRFFNKTSVATSKKLLSCAIRRFDLDADSRLNKLEFQEGIKTQNVYSKRKAKNLNASYVSVPSHVTLVSSKRPKTGQKKPGRN